MPSDSVDSKIKLEDLEKIKLIEQIAEDQLKALDPNQKDSKVLLEFNRLETDKQEHEQKKRNLKIDYVGRLFLLIVGWLVVVLVYVLMAGFKWKGFELSDNVLIAFITSTTVSVIGLFHYVAKWLYPNELLTSPNDEDKKDK